jgi:hypothetical protein
MLQVVGKCFYSIIKHKTMSKILYLGAGAAALAYLAMQNKGATTPATNPTATTQPTNPGQLIPGVLGVGEQIELSVDSVPKYRTWKRAQWAQLWALMVQEYGPVEALQRLYMLWSAQENPLAANIPTREALLFQVSTYRPPTMAGIGQLDPIEWNSTPIYDTFTNYWNGVDTWGCTHWKIWHQKLEAYYGDTMQANQIWEPAWNDPDNECWALGSFGCPQTANCRYDCDFVKYLKSKNLPIGNLISNTTCDISNVISAITTSASNIATGAQQSSAVLSALLPIGVAVLGGLWIYNKAKK